jgi:hypothetical protein
MTGEVLTQVIRVLKTPVTLIALLLILIGGGYWGLKAVSTPTAAAAATCVQTDVGKELTPDKVTVQVFNGSDTPRLAKDTRNYLLAYHFLAFNYNNTTQVIDHTIVLGNSVDSPEVKLVQQFFPGSEAQADGRPTHVVDVLVGGKVTQDPNPKTSFPVSGPVCLPARTTATASANATPVGTGTPAPSQTPTKK